MQHIIDSKRENFSTEKVDENASSSIFRHIVSGDMPESERSVKRLSREAMVLFGAGTATTARTMGFISYYLLTNPHMRECLGNELKDIMADYPENLPTWAKLEKLPYLQAVIKEGLR
jgi:cytochrome P450